MITSFGMLSRLSSILIFFCCSWTANFYHEQVDVTMQRLPYVITGYESLIVTGYPSRGVDRHVSALPGNPLIGGRVR